MVPWANAINPQPPRWLSPSASSEQQHNRIIKFFKYVRFTHTRTHNCIFILLLLYVSAATTTTRDLINFRKLDSTLPPQPPLGPREGGNKNNRFQFLIGFGAFVFVRFLRFTTLTLSGKLYIYRHIKNIYYNEITCIRLFRRHRK